MQTTPLPLGRLVAALLLFALAFFAWPARAVQLEVGLGGTLAQPVGNGGWYQEGFPHTLNLRSRAWMIGATDDITPGWAWHVQYVHLGRYSSDAMAADRDEDYNPVTQACNPGCNLARYRGTGSVQGLAATIERYTMTSGGVRLSAEAGPFFFRPEWRVQVDNWKPAKDAPGMTIYAANPGRVKVGAVAGVSVGQGAWALSLRQYWDKCTPSTDACLWRSTRTLMLTYRF